MGRYDDNDDDFDYLPLQRPALGDDRPHSRQGLVSLGIALVGGMCTATLVVAALVIDAQPVPLADEDLWMGLAGLVLLGCGVMSIAGIVLGMVGSMQSDRKPHFAILGAIANVLVLLGMFVAVCAGVLSDL